jgi:hypothetical protein
VGAPPSETPKAPVAPAAPAAPVRNAPSTGVDLARKGTRLAWLADAFGLSASDLLIIVIALAPELDLRYERLYAYLQDDVSRRWPSVDLTLNLLCTSSQEKASGRAWFAPDAPLLRHALISLGADARQAHAPLLAQAIRLDDQVVRFLLCQDGLDSRLAPLCHLMDPDAQLDQAQLSPDDRRSLPALVIQAREDHLPFRLYFKGPFDYAKRYAAEALAREAGARLLTADLARLAQSDADFERSLHLLLREAWFFDHVILLSRLDALDAPEHESHRQQLLELLGADSGVVILSGKGEWSSHGQPSLGVVTVPFGLPDEAARTEEWRSQLAMLGTPLGEDELRELGDRFRLTPEQIADAAYTAYNTSLKRAAAREANGSYDRPTSADLLAAARQQAGGELAALAHKVEPVYGWGSIVLPADSQTQLHEICQRVRHNRLVMREWGFGPMIARGKGVSALFAGPPGTGKTMAAEIIARDLGLDLYKIDLSVVISKYVGETEKNLERIFGAAEDANAILFFDESDAIFGKRSEVRDSHDRYANIEIAFLLQRMEDYDGLSILATNLRQNMDEAFVRRLQYVVEFPFPDEQQRRDIWVKHFPSHAPVEGSIDFAFLGRQFKVSGGNIKNIVLNAAFMAASNGGVIGMKHVLQATRREYQKMGKPLSAADFDRYAPLFEPVTRVP